MTARPQPPSILTRNQQLVLTELNDAETPLSAYTLLDNLRTQGLRAPLQIYRALEKLMIAGLVHRLESLNSFVACQHAHCHHHKTIAFTICDDCDRVSELSDDELSKMIGTIASNNEFRLEHSVVELRGRCQACSVSHVD